MRRHIAFFLFLALGLGLANCNKDPDNPNEDSESTLWYEVEDEQYVLLTQASGQRWLFQVTPSNNAVLVNWYSHGYNYAAMNAQFSYRDEYKGDLVIPESFTHNGTTYTVTKIENSAFECCDNLNSITIPNTIKYLGEAVFITCFGLRNVELPPTLDSISHQCFFGCESLQTIQFPDSLRYIGVLAFYHSGLKELDFKKNIKIDEQAFSNCKELVTVSFPEGMDTINDAFSSCENLFSVSMPQSVKVVLANSFLGCSYLSEITCFASTPPQFEYDLDVFEGTPLTVIYVPAESVDAYKSANGWRNYADIIQAIN